MGDEPFEDRMAHLATLFHPETGKHADPQIIIVDQVAAKDRDHVLERLKEVETLGGEGVMLRKAGSTYVGGRSNTLMKVKVRN